MEMRVLGLLLDKLSTGIFVIRLAHRPRVDAWVSSYWNHTMGCTRSTSGAWLQLTERRCKERAFIQRNHRPSKEATCALRRSGRMRTSDSDCTPIRLHSACTWPEAPSPRCSPRDALKRNGREGWLPRAPQRQPRRSRHHKASGPCKALHTRQVKSGTRQRNTPKDGVSTPQGPCTDA